MAKVFRRAEASEIQESRVDAPRTEHCLKPPDPASAGRFFVQFNFITLCISGMQMFRFVIYDVRHPKATIVIS
jgi:hypothetical protein